MGRGPTAHCAKGMSFKCFPSLTPAHSQFRNDVGEGDLTAPQTEAHRPQQPPSSHPIFHFQNTFMLPSGPFIFPG